MTHESLFFLNNMTSNSHLVKTVKIGFRKGKKRDGKNGPFLAFTTQRLFLPFSEKNHE